MKQIMVVAGDGKYQVRLDGFCTEGKGICAFMTGGIRPHNGGTVVANPRLKSNAQTSTDFTADIWVSGVPGHKDTEIGIPVAKILATKLNEAISLTVGIHIDHASKKEIEMLITNCKLAAERFIAEYQKDQPD